MKESCPKRSAVLSMARIYALILTITQTVASLEHIFAKYCTPSPTNRADALSAGTKLQPPEGAVLTDDALDTWALDTNGALLSDGEKAELEMLDVDDDGRLTCVVWLYTAVLEA